MVGVADRMRRPGRAAIDAVAATGTIGREEAGCALVPVCLPALAWLICGRCGVGPVCAGRAPQGSDPRLLQGQGARPDHLGYAGRRVLVSRKWSGKTLADHRGDRKQWLMDMLGLSATDDTDRFRWEQVTPNDTDYLPPPQRLVQVVAERMRWKHALDETRRRAQERETDRPETRSAA